MKSDQSWGVDRLIANKGKVSFTIPSCIEAGQYLLRAEIIGAYSHRKKTNRYILTFL